MKKSPFSYKKDDFFSVLMFFKCLPYASLHLKTYLRSKLSQQVQLSASQLQVLPTWILRNVQKSPARLYLHSVTPQPMEVFTSFSFIIKNSSLKGKSSICKFIKDY